MASRGVFATAVVLAALALLSLQGCTTLIEKAARSAAKRSSAKTFRLYASQRENFQFCLRHPGGICEAPHTEEEDDNPFADEVARTPTVYDGWAFTTFDPVGESGDSAFADDAVARSARSVGADAAREVLRDDLQNKLNIFYMASRGAPLNEADRAYINAFADVEETGGKQSYTIAMSTRDIERYQDKIEQATLLDGWSALHDEALSSDFGDDDTGALTEDKIRRAYIKAYFEAYFRGGKVFQLSINATQIREKIKNRLQSELPGLEDADYERLVSDRFRAIGFDERNNRFFASLGSRNLVTRDGQALGFPGFSASFDLGSSNFERRDIDYVAVGTDLIRVLLHAIYDARQRLPAVSNATGVTAQLPGGIGLEINDSARVTEEQFQRIQMRANQVEGVIASGTGRLVRGISVLALNNEALATAIETAVGLAVRKQTERLLYCWYACGLGQGQEHPSADYEATSSGQVIEITVSLTDGSRT